MRIRGSPLCTRVARQTKKGAPSVPRPAGPLVHQLRLLVLELRSGHEKGLRVFVLELHDFLGRLEEEGRLAVRERYDGSPGSSVG